MPSDAPEPSSSHASSPGAEAQQRASYEPSELIVVTSHYDLGVIESAREYRRGSRRSPKVLLKTRMGTFLLKRRAAGRDDPKRIALSHGIQRHLTGRGFPLPRLISTKTSADTILQLESGSYELFEFVEGTPYDQSSTATYHAGQALALFHRLLADFDPGMEVPASSYHASPLIPAHLERIAAMGKGAQAIAFDLRQAYERAGSSADSCGVARWPLQIIHGDWHPGNLLYDASQVVAVIDYDTARLGQRVLDVANGALQFSVTRDRGSPDEWPDALDEGRLRRFLRGYDSIEGCVVSRREIGSLPSLMIEALIAEAAVPIATTGRFASIEGESFLKMVARKVRWLEAETPKLVEALA